jgi:hypothetical protein
MSTPMFVRLMALVLPMLLIPASSSFAADTTPPDLLVRINLPEWPEGTVPAGLNAAYFLKQLSTTSEYDLRLREAFLQRLSQVFKAKGYTGRMALIDNVSNSLRGLPILSIDLERWNAADGGELGLSGRFDCAFKAKLVTPRETVDLGSLDYTDRFAFGKGMPGAANIEQATDAALAKFHAKLLEDVKLGLLPGGT